MDEHSEMTPSPETPMPDNTDNLEISGDNPNPVWLPERLERARQAAVRSLLSELGYEDVEMLQAALAQIPQLHQEREAAQTQANSALEARRNALLEAAFIQAAGQYDFIHPDEARRLLDWDSITLDDGGNIQGMAEAIARLVEARPHLIRRRSWVMTEAGIRMAGSPSQRSTDPRDMPPEQVEDIKRRFKLW